jgi:hypothetical protein
MPPQFPPTYKSFDCPLCDKKCRSSGGLQKHKDSKHPKVTLPEDATRYTRVRHPYLNGNVQILFFVSCPIVTNFRATMHT